MSPRPAESVTTPFDIFIAEASRRFGIPAALVRAVMRAESYGEPHALSPKGAMGLMQIMPETWAGLRQRYGLGVNPYDSHDNIIAGVAFLREMYDRFGAVGFLEAYNAGPARWEDHLATGRPLPAETEEYIDRVAAQTIKGGVAHGEIAAASTIPARTTVAPVADRSSDPPASREQPTRAANYPENGAILPTPSADLPFLRISRAW